MATLSEMMMTNAQASIPQNAPGAGIPDAMSKGVQLAQQREQTETLKLQQAEMREKLETGKFQKATAYLQNLARARPEIAKRMIPKVQESLQQSGIMMDPGILDLMASDEQYKQRFGIIGSALMGQANDPETRTKAMEAFGDIGMFDEGLKLFEGQNKMEAQTEQARMRAEAAERALAAQNQRFYANPNNTTTVGQQTLDKKFADTYEDFVAGGQYAGVQRNIADLEPVLQKLAAGKGSGDWKALAPDSWRAKFKDKNLTVQRAVERVVQGTMRTTLGAQFTEKEGVNVLARTFDKNADPKDNANSVRQVLKELEQIAKAKQAAAQYWEANGGTLNGYKGSTRFNFGGQVVDVAPDAKAKTAAAGGTPPPTQTPPPDNAAKRATYVQWLMKNKKLDQAAAEAKAKQDYPDAVAGR